MKDELIKKVLAEKVVVVPGTPKSPITMSTPGSKSISNRALVLAALAKGTCRLRNLLHSDDTQVMMTALLELQVGVHLFCQNRIDSHRRVLLSHGKTPERLL